MFAKYSRFHRHTVKAVLVVALSIGLYGCGSNDAPTGEVSGIIKYKGEPLPDGTIVFQSEDGQHGASGRINDGRYSLPNCPAGHVLISISGGQPGSNLGPGMKAMPEGQKKMAAQMMKNQGQAAAVPEEGTAKKAILIPARYRDVKTSGLSADVKEGEKQELKTIELQP